MTEKETEKLETPAWFNFSKFTSGLKEIYQRVGGPTDSHYTSHELQYTDSAGIIYKGQMTNQTPIEVAFDRDVMRLFLSCLNLTNIEITDLRSFDKHVHTILSESDQQLPHELHHNTIVTFASFVALDTI